jgi:hypothetical protein
MDICPEKPPCSCFTKLLNVYNSFSSRVSHGRISFSRLIHLWCCGVASIDLTFKFDSFIDSAQINLRSRLNETYRYAILVSCFHWTLLR